MKKCPWCGKEYSDDATICAVDSHPLRRPDGSEIPPTSASTEPPAKGMDAATRQMVIGGFWFVGGILVTAVTYASATASPFGGTYVVAWGAIVFGGVQFLRGLARRAGPNEASREPGAAGPGPATDVTVGAPWVCHDCGETSEAHFTRCWNCRSPREENVGRQPASPGPRGQGDGPHAD